MQFLLLVTHGNSWMKVFPVGGRGTLRLYVVTRASLREKMRATAVVARTFCIQTVAFGNTKAVLDP